MGFDQNPMDDEPIDREEYEKWEEAQKTANKITRKLRKSKFASDFSPNERVIYVPGQAEGDYKHPDCEHGAVSSTNEKFVFVKFDQHVKKFGWGGATSQACDPNDLVSVSNIVSRS